MRSKAPVLGVHAEKGLVEAQVGQHRVDEGPLPITREHNVQREVLQGVWG